MNLEVAEAASFFLISMPYFCISYMVQPNTKGADFNFFTKVTVIDGYFGGATGESDVYINIKGQQTISLVNEGNAVVEYSFNGNTLHGDMTPNSPTTAIFFDNRRVSAIWFRTTVPGQIIRVEAWSRI